MVYFIVKVRELKDQQKIEVEDILIVGKNEAGDIFDIFFYSGAFSYGFLEFQEISH